MKKLIALLLVLVMVVAVFAGCGGDNNETKGNDTPDVTDTKEWEGFVSEPSAVQLVNGKEYGVDYTDLYGEVGKGTSIADVQEDDATGLAYLEVDGELHELGLDFLSMAMVYNCSPEGTDYETEDDVYAAWWKLYMQRWNYMMPEVPLYSNEYYDLYNAKIKGVEEYPTNPYWPPASALIDWTSEKESKDIIIGNTTDLSGKFRASSFGASSPGAADLDIDELVNGLETIATTKEGGYEVNKTVVKNMEYVDNEDGTRTYTIEIYDDMVFSDGSPVTAKNYLYYTMVFSTQVAAQAANGYDKQSGKAIVGFKTFNAYTGSNEGEEATKEFSGLHLLGDYSFSVTISADYLPYFYSITYAGFAPYYKDIWMGDSDIADDGNGVYITGDFYAMTGDSYNMASHISDSAWNTDDTYPYSGPYCVESYDASEKTAVLVANPNFKGNYEGTKAGIEKVIYKKIVTETQLEDFKTGGIDVIAGITGGPETDEAIALADESNGAYVYTHYSRAGYGKLGFRADYGPAQYTAVRQALSYALDRATFAKDFTGGYGGVVDGPYYTGSWMYKAAVAQGMTLDAYETSVDTAIAVLEADGWVYNAEGKQYTEGVRYKRISGEYATENDKNFKSIDGTYKTVEIDGDYYMPLVLNWFGTSENTFTDQLVTGFEQSANVAAAGFAIQKTMGDFYPMLDELYQQQVYGYYSGSPMYTCFNFATGFNSAAYDQAYYHTIDAGMYADYSQYYLIDEADILWLN